MSDDPVQALKAILEAAKWQDTCPHDSEPDICDGCAYAREKALAVALQQARDTLAALGGSGWQPIETAPKDGTKVMLFYPVQGHRVEPTVLVGRVPPGATDATHWMPLPPPPTLQDLA